MLGRQLDIPVHAQGTEVPPPKICANAVKSARQGAHDVIILDTAGRLHIDDELMEELAQVKAKTNPKEVLLVADAMTGQDAVRAASSFHERVGLTGLILTKIDGDARGGAAISIRSVTNVPIKFLGTGEKSSDLEQFHPDRMASRILGMGDILTLIERAESALDQDKAQRAGERLTGQRIAQRSGRSITAPRQLCRIPERRAVRLEPRGHCGFIARLMQAHKFTNFLHPRQSDHRLL